MPISLSLPPRRSSDLNLAPTIPVEAYQPTPLLMIHGTLYDKAPYEGGMAGIHAKRTRGEVLSARATGAYFAERNGAGAPQTSNPYPDVEITTRSEEHTSELQSRGHLVCRLLLEKKKKT